MKHSLTKLLVLCVLVATGAMAFGQITVGQYTGGNCYPFMCNDSGTNMGQTMDYQQAYLASAISSSPVTISSLTWYFASQFGGSDLLLGGQYTVEWGYTTNAPNNLSSNLPSNYSSGPFTLGSFTVPAGGQSFGNSFTFSAFTPFVYNPADGNLLLEIVADNQDNVPNGSGNSYMEADTTGSGVVGRAYCIENIGCNSDSVGLVTTFGTSTATTVPEPSTFMMLGSGLAGLGLLRRKFKF